MSHNNSAQSNLPQHNCTSSVLFLATPGKVCGLKWENRLLPKIPWQALPGFYTFFVRPFITGSRWSRAKGRGNLHQRCYCQTDRWGRNYHNHIYQQCGVEPTCFMLHFDSLSSGLFPFFPTETTNPDFLISSFAIHKQLGIGREWSQEVQNVTQTELRYSYRFICNDNYYGDTCSKICTPRDDRFGHYTCKSDGQIACLPGWKGEYCQERKQEYKTPCGHLMLFVGLKGARQSRF